MFRSSRRATPAAFLALFLLAACSSTDSRLPVYRGNPKQPGSVARVERIGFYPAFALRGLLWYAGVKNVDIGHAIQLYRVSYWSRSDGHPVLVSALLSVPHDGAARGTVLYMHGTHTGRADSVSNPSLEEGLFVAAVFAGGGYVEIAPDLAGLGVSHDPQPYFFTPATVDQESDALTAARRVAADLGRRWNADLYLAGFSQGAHATALMQRALEERRDPALHVRAAAGIGGVYDLDGVEFPFLLKGMNPKYSGYLEAFATSYATFYHEPLQSLLKPKYAASARTMLDGDHNDDFSKQLPTDPHDLFTPAFLAAYDASQPFWFTTDMKKNDAYDWAPAAPFRAYYGDRDLDASPQNSLEFGADAKKRGGHIQLVMVGHVDHGGSAYLAVPMIRSWFDRLSSAPDVQR